MSRKNPDRVRVANPNARRDSERLNNRSEKFSSNQQRNSTSEHFQATRSSYVNSRNVNDSSDFGRNRKEMVSETASKTLGTPKVTPPNGYIPCAFCTQFILESGLKKHLFDQHGDLQASKPVADVSATPVPRVIATSTRASVAITQPALSLYAPSPFSDKDLRDWFFDSFSLPALNVEGIATLGSGPFNDVEFDDFVYHHGLVVYLPEEDSELLVVGREGWDVALEDMLDQRAGKILKVYSQEMFLSYWASGHDPFDLPDVVRRFGEGHPALEYLAGIGFDWPTTIVPGGKGDFDEELPTVGVLKYFGYTVGRNGLEDDQRQEVLTHVFSSSLSSSLPIEYLREWGNPKSKERLQKMANSIAAFCRNEKRKSNPSELAITDWESDLAWSKKTFYSGRFTFRWPTGG
jgi:hypothetical protein